MEQALTFESSQYLSVCLRRSVEREPCSGLQQLCRGGVVQGKATLEPLSHDRRF